MKNIRCETSSVLMDELAVDHIPGVERNVHDIVWMSIWRSMTYDQIGVVLRTVATRIKEEMERP